MTLAGQRCLNVPSAVAYHRHKSRGTTKVFYQVRNRWFFILKLYSWRTLVLSLRMLAAFELLQAVPLVAKGSAVDYWRANWAVLRTLPKTLKKRRAFAVLKTKRDREWLRAGRMFVPGGFLTRRWSVAALSTFDGVTKAYWRFIRSFC